jgi:hypothetical protein
LIKQYEDETALIIINVSEKDLTFQTFQVKTFLPEAKTLFNLETNKYFDISKDEILTINRMNSEIFLINK